MSNIVPFSENGGFVATNFYTFIPVQTSDLSSVYIGIFDTSNFNDTVDGSSYSYRQEDVMVGRVPTCRRIFLTYRDLGLVTLTVTVSGIDDNDATVSVSQTVALGTKAATGNLLSQFVDITMTAFRPQLSWSKTAGAGNLAIVSATMILEVEETSL